MSIVQQERRYWLRLIRLTLLLIYGEHKASEGHAREQYEAAGEPKALWAVPGCGEGGYLQAAPEEWER